MNAMQKQVRPLTNRQLQRRFVQRHPGYYQTWRRNHPMRIRQLHRKATRRYRQKHPKRVKARLAAQEFPLLGYCELCPEDDRRTTQLERHHPDYRFAWLFVTVCHECHIWLEK